ncbi:hypothetical protein D5S17_31260 [Pseudonocardiaceae bacterium YIM PH 21723]|nr:hypothetical protein D5S17_31260 [Pseudonocardiaceae bacterium YIM PH 21723]
MTEKNPTPEPQQPAGEPTPPPAPEPTPAAQAEPPTEQIPVPQPPAPARPSWASRNRGVLGLVGIGVAGLLVGGIVTGAIVRPGGHHPGGPDRIAVARPFPNHGQGDGPQFRDGRPGEMRQAQPQRGAEQRGGERLVGTVKSVDGTKVTVTIDGGQDVTVDLGNRASNLKAGEKVLVGVRVVPLNPGS